MPRRPQVTLRMRQSLSCFLFLAYRMRVINYYYQPSSPTESLRRRVTTDPVFAYAYLHASIENNLEVSAENLEVSAESSIEASDRSIENPVPFPQTVDRGVTLFGGCIAEQVDAHAAAVARQLSHLMIGAYRLVHAPAFNVNTQRAVKGESERRWPVPAELAERRGVTGGIHVPHCSPALGVVKERLGIRAAAAAMVATFPAVAVHVRLAEQR